MLIDPGMPNNNKKRNAKQQQKTGFHTKTENWVPNSYKKRESNHDKKLDDKPQQKKVFQTTTENRKPNHSRKRDAMASKNSHNKEIS